MIQLPLKLGTGLNNYISNKAIGCNYLSMSCSGIFFCVDFPGLSTLFNIAVRQWSRLDYIYDRARDQAMRRIVTFITSFLTGWDLPQPWIGNEPRAIADSGCHYDISSQQWICRLRPCWVTTLPELAFHMICGFRTSILKIDTSEIKFRLRFYQTGGYKQHINPILLVISRNDMQF